MPDRATFNQRITDGCEEALLLAARLEGHLDSLEAVQAAHRERLLAIQAEMLRPKPIQTVHIVQTVRARLETLQSQPGYLGPEGAWWSWSEIEALLNAYDALRRALADLLAERMYYGAGCIHGVRIGAWERAGKALKNHE
ncbi:MAG: hypothetical protein AB1641_09805 [Thermodesulfobacteriota bacterium]